MVEVFEVRTILIDLRESFIEEARSSFVNGRMKNDNISVTVDHEGDPSRMWYANEVMKNMCNNVKIHEIEEKRTIFTGNLKEVIEPSKDFWKDIFDEYF